MKLKVKSQTISLSNSLEGRKIIMICTINWCFNKIWHYIFAWRKYQIDNKIDLKRSIKIHAEIAELYKCNGVPMKQPLWEVQLIYRNEPTFKLDLNELNILHKITYRLTYYIRSELNDWYKIRTNEANHHN